MDFAPPTPGLLIAGHMRNGISLPDCINAGRTAADRVMGASSGFGTRARRGSP